MKNGGQQVFKLLLILACSMLALSACGQESASETSELGDASPPITAAASPDSTIAPNSDLTPEATIELPATPETTSMAVTPAALATSTSVATVSPNPPSTPTPVTSVNLDDAESTAKTEQTASTSECAGYRREPIIYMQEAIGSLEMAGLKFDFASTETVPFSTELFKWQGPNGESALTLAAWMNCSQLGITALDQGYVNATSADLVEAGTFGAWPLFERLLEEDSVDPVENVHGANALSVVVVSKDLGLFTKTISLSDIEKVRFEDLHHPLLSINGMRWREGLKLYLESDLPLTPLLLWDLAEPTFDPLMYEIATSNPKVINLIKSNCETLEEIASEYGYPVFQLSKIGSCDAFSTSENTQGAITGLDYINTVVGEGIEQCMRERGFEYYVSADAHLASEELFRSGLEGDELTAALEAQVHSPQTDSMTRNREYVAGLSPKEYEGYIDALLGSETSIGCYQLTKNKAWGVDVSEQALNDLRDQTPANNN